MLVDLHCHSNNSDGSLTVVELISQANERELKYFSITDHDTLAAYEGIENMHTNTTIITGIEFSTTWNKIGIHVVGLNIDLDNSQLKKAVVYQKNARINRAKIIARKLEKIGLKNSYETLAKANKNKQIGRPDFANLLVEKNIVKDHPQAFKKYLGAGKSCDVKNQWLSLEKIIESINLAGGIAVLAHPLYYKLTNAKLKRLLIDFISFGGRGLEVVNGYQNPDKTQYLKKLCEEYGLLASIGSDFHHPKQWKRLGCDSNLVQGLECVWDVF